MKARGSALKVTWKEVKMIFLSHRGYNIKECQKAFQESTLFGLLVALRPNSSVAAAQGCLFSCHSGRGSGEVETAPALATEQTPAGIPKSLPASWPHLPGASQTEGLWTKQNCSCTSSQGECQDSAEQLQEQGIDWAAQLWERSASCQGYTGKLRNRNSKHWNSPETKKGKKNNKRKKRNQTNAQQTNNWKW